MPLSVDLWTEAIMSNENGFTLLEILLALSILAVVGTMIGYGLHSTVQVVEATRDQREVYRFAQTAFSRISDDLSSVVAYPDIGFEGASPDEDAEAESILSLVSLAHLSFDGSETGASPARIQYRLSGDADSEDGLKLLRDDTRILPGQSDKEDEIRGFVLAGGLRQVQLAFIDQESQEADSWDSLSLVEDDADATDQVFPQAVRITLQFFVNGGQDETLTLETLIWLPTVVIAAETREN